MGNAIKKIGLFGGTFDPFHLGHLNVAIQLMERGSLDEIWFIPAFISPFRLRETPVSCIHRYQMIERAIENIPNFRVMDIEIKEERPSFTIDTIRKIRKNDPKNHYFLLLGSDAALEFHRWKEAIEIVCLVDLMIAERKDVHLESLIQNSSIESSVKDALLKGIFVTPMMDIDARVVRKRLKEKLYCGHLLPAKVLDYIYENQLYSIS